MNEAITNYLSRIGRKGGKATTEAKRIAVRRNGKKGGRPKRRKEITKGQEAASTR